MHLFHFSPFSIIFVCLGFIFYFLSFLFFFFFGGGVAPSNIFTAMSTFVRAAFGGIYLDTDEVLLQPMNDLLQHHVTMGWERRNHSFGNGLFLAEPNSPFLNAWYNKYKKFTNAWWGYFSTVVPRQLYIQHPEFNIHVVDTFFRPDLWNITKLLYEAHYDWSNHYALHLYYRRNQKYFRGNFEQRNTTLGEIARHILFGDKKKCV